MLPADFPTSILVPSFSTQQERTHLPVSKVAGNRGHLLPADYTFKDTETKHRTVMYFYMFPSNPSHQRIFLTGQNGMFWVGNCPLKTY